jgi:hypothetical protein
MPNILTAWIAGGSNSLQDARVGRREGRADREVMSETVEEGPVMESRELKADQSDIGRVPAEAGPIARVVGSRPVGARAAGALGLGALALGALAIGALAIGRLAIHRLTVGRSAITSLKIGELEVGTLRVRTLEVLDATDRKP